MVRASDPAKPGLAVPDDHRLDVREQGLDCGWLAAGRLGGEIAQPRPVRGAGGTGHRLDEPSLRHTGMIPTLTVAVPSSGQLTGKPHRRAAAFAGREYGE